MSTENIKADIIEARSVTVKYNTNIGEGGGITINNLNVEEEIKQNKLRNQTLENKIDSHINDTESESRKHILPEEIKTIDLTKTKVEKLEGQIIELDDRVDDISRSIDKPEIQAHKVSIVANEEEPGILTVNGTNIVDKIESAESDISLLQNKVDAHTHDVGRVVYDENRIHLTQDDIRIINTVESKAEKSEVEDLEATITELTEIVNTKANETDLNNLAANCVTYEPRSGYNAITKENLTFTKDLSFKNAQIIMHNNNIVLHNHCANIEGPESYILIKDAKVSNLVEVKGTGETGSIGDVTLERNGEWYSVWDHLTNKVKHITKEERDRWNAKTDRTIFVLADADEEGYPAVDNPNTTYIYLVADPAAPEDSDFHYNKWAWVERKDIPEEYAWEKIGSPVLKLEPGVDNDIKDESVIDEETYTIKHNITLNKADKITDEEEKAPTSKAVAEYVGDELKKYVSKAGDTMSGDLEMTALDGGTIPSIKLNGGAIHVNAIDSESHTNIYNYGIETPLVKTDKLSPNESTLNKITVTNAENEDTTPVTFTVSGNSTETLLTVDAKSAANEYAEFAVGGDIIVHRNLSGENSGVYIGNTNTGYTLALNGKNLGNAISENTENITNLTVRVDALEANHFIVVPSIADLPNPEDAMPNAIYLVPKEGEQEDNVKDEYIAVEVEPGVKKWEKIGDTKIDLSGYITKEEAKEDFVNVTGDTMSGQLAFTDTSVAAIQLPYDDGITESGHIVFGGNTSSKLECTDISSHAITLNTANTSVENATNAAMMTSTGLMLAVVEPSGDLLSMSFIDNEGNVMASNSVQTYSTVTNRINVNSIYPYDDSVSKNITLYGNLQAPRISGSTDFGTIWAGLDLKAGRNLNVNENAVINGKAQVNKELNVYGESTFYHFANFTEEARVNKVLPLAGSDLIVFTTFNSNHFDVVFSRTSTIGGPTVTISASEDAADVVIRGESVYDHIKNPHLHLTDDQLRVLNAAENGCFIFKPTDPDPTRPDEPYKGVNPKLILKNTEDKPNGYREATLQVDYDIGSSLELKKDDNAYTAILSNGNHTTGSKLEINDNGVLIASSYYGPAAITPNARTTIMGDTAIGDSTTNYTFTVNGKDIAGPVINFEEHVNDKSIHVNAAQKAALDERQIDDYTNKTQSVSQFGNVITAGVIDRAFVGTKNIIASLTLKTAGDGTIPGDERKLAIYACNASTLPARIANNGKLADTTTCRFIGLSDDTNVISNYDTEYTWHFENLKLNDNDKFIIFSIVDKNAVLNADDFKHTNIKILTLAQRANEKSVVFGPQFGPNNNAPYYEIGLCDGYIIENLIKDYKDGKPLINPSSDITLINDSVFNVSNSPIVIIPADITDKLIKSTILFKPATDVQVVNLFSGNVVDKIICYEETLLEGKVSIIEITHLNANDTDYITATIMPNIK